jgi:LysM repeat protein
MERICPYLATAADGRAVVDGFDEAHVCRAGDEPEPVDRDRQLERCLLAEHKACDRYLVATASHGADASPAPAPDAAIVRTRLVLTPEPSHRGLAAGALAARSRRWIVGAAIGTMGVVVVAAGVVGGLSGIASGPSASPTSSPSAAGSPSPTVSASTAPTATPVPTAQPTSAPTVAPTSAPSSVSTPSAQPQTYVVQPGDTLNGIAVRFGTTVQALQQANGLGASDVILVGQVLIIP